MDGKKIKLQIWDTAGQERFRTITTAYYRGAMGIMLVYDVTNEKSFDNIKNWIRNIEEHASSDVEKMILGNKCDIHDRRQVSRERGEQLAIEYNIKFMETSAKSSFNVEEAFFTLAKDIKAKMERKLVCFFKISSILPLIKSNLFSSLLCVSIDRNRTIKVVEVIIYGLMNLQKNNQKYGFVVFFDLATIIDDDYPSSTHSMLAEQRYLSINFPTRNGPDALYR